MPQKILGIFLIIAQISCNRFLFPNDTLTVLKKIPQTAKAEWDLFAEFSIHNHNTNAYSKEIHWHAFLDD